MKQNLQEQELKDSTLYVKDIKTDSTSVYVAYMLENDDEKYMYNFSGAGAKVSKTLKIKLLKLGLFFK